MMYRHKYLMTFCMPVGYEWWWQKQNQVLGSKLLSCFCDRNLSKRFEKNDSKLTDMDLFYLSWFSESRFYEIILRKLVMSISVSSFKDRQVQGILSSGDLCFVNGVEAFFGELNIENIIGWNWSHRYAGNKIIIH